MEDAVVDLDQAFLRRDGHEVLLLAVVAHEFAVVELRQYVAVHDDERRVESLDEPERCGSAQGVLLAHVFDRETVRRAVADDSLDQVRQVPDGERDVEDAVAVELSQDNLEDCLVADRHQRFREYARVRREARPSSAGQNDGPHQSLSRWRRCDRSGNE